MSNNLQIFRILLLFGLASSTLAQTLTDTLTLSHGLRISGPNVTFTFRTNCPNDTIFCCKLGDEEYQICTSPVIYYNLPPGDYSVSVKAQAVKLGQPLEVAIADRNFTITNPVVVQPLTVQGSAESLGDSVRVTFTANMPATFQCRINNGNFFTCSSPYTFSNLAEGSHVITVRGTATADPTRIGTYNVRVSVTKPNENFRVNGRYTLSSTNKLTLRFSATEEASFRCRIVKHSPPPPFTTAWIPCSDGIMYTNMTCGLFTAEIEATSTSNPSTQSLLRLQQIVIPCSTDCNGVPQLQGTASVSVDAPNATLNVNLNGPAILTCRLNDGPQEMCHDKFTYRNLAVKNHTLLVTATSTCDPSQQLLYRTIITIGAPVDGGWSSWVNLPCSIPNNMCGVGSQLRVRGCINPIPQNGGKPCKGRNMDTRSCGTPCNDTSQTLSVTGLYHITGNDVQVFFNASLPANFRCKLDGDPPVPCVSGHTFRNLSVGKHQVQVIARLSSNPQTRKTLKLQRFTIQPPPTTAPPPPPPPHVTAVAQVFDNCSTRLTFSANISATYRCRVNGGPWEACSSGYLASNLQTGINTIEIEATSTENPNIKTIGSATINLTGQTCPLLDINHPVCNPSVVGDSFTITFEATVPNVEYSCKLNNKRPRPCNRTVTYSNLKRQKTNVVTITATTAKGETVSKNFTFVSLYNSKFCRVYECSDGVVVNGNTAMVTFTSDDPGARFKCKLNGKRIRRCTSPLELEELSPGSYKLDITPTCARKAKGKKQTITFTIA